MTTVCHYQKSISYETVFWVLGGVVQFDSSGFRLTVVGVGRDNPSPYRRNRANTVGCVQLTTLGARHHLDNGNGVGDFG